MLLQLALTLISINIHLLYSVDYTRAVLLTCFNLRGLTKNCCFNFLKHFMPHVIDFHTERTLTAEYDFILLPPSMKNIYELILKYRQVFITIVTPWYQKIILLQKYTKL